jgi:hypothetical protein
VFQKPHSAFPRFALQTQPLSRATKVKTPRTSSRNCARSPHRRIGPSSMSTLTA